LGLSVSASMATQQVRTIADLHRQFNEWWELEIYQSCNFRRTLFGSKIHFLGSSCAQLVNILDSVSSTLPPQTTTQSFFPLQPHFDHRYASCAISCEGVDTAP
jgi:hypothetical protein